MFSRAGHRFHVVGGWHWVHACFPAVGASCSSSLHPPHFITLVLVEQKIYTAPSGNKNMVDFPVYYRSGNSVIMWHLLFQVDSLKEICEETLRKDIDDDTVLLCLGVAEQFSVSRLKVRATLIYVCIPTRN